MRKSKDKLDSTSGKAPWQIVVTCEDDALTPVIEQGSDIVVDCSARTLVDGGIYAIREGDSLKLWLFHEGFAGQGSLIAGRRIGTLSSLAGAFRCRGPVLVDKILVVGRVAEPASAMATTSSSLAALRQERSALVNRLEETRSALRRVSGTTPGTDLLERNGASGSITRLARRFEEAMQNKSFARRFALEQRMDAIGSRLIYLEEQIADVEVEDVDGVYTKLQVLWDLHYAPFPTLQSDLSARFISSALRGLGKSGRVTAERDAEPEVEERAPSAAIPPIQLVASPRHR